MIKALLFDLDGVIVDTAKYHYKAWKALANSLGFDFTEKDNERLKGVSRVRSLEILLEIDDYKATEEEKIEFARSKNERYVEFISVMDASEILPGVLDFINEARDKGYRIALGSASKNAPLILQKTGIEALFDAVIDGNQVSAAKPDPEVFLKGAAALKAKPEECIVFEDAEAGIEAAVNAKMAAVGIGSPEVLNKADVVLPGFAGITLDELIARINKKRTL